MRILALLMPLALLAQTPRFTDPGRKGKLMPALAEIDRVFERYFKQRQIPGLVYGVVMDGEAVHFRGYGFQDDKTKAPVTADTMFRIASMTKSYTALAILKLRDAGKLSLEDPVAKWIPEIAGLRYPTNDTPPLVIRQLLTHGAGFPEDNPWGDRQLAIPDAELSRWIDRGIPFSSPPDSTFEYSNYGFALLGRIVAKASGKTYQEYLTAEILRPLGLASTSLEPAAVPAALRATGYGRAAGKLFEIPSLAHGSFGSMGGLVTSARDMARYVAFHLSAYPARDGEEAGPVRRSSVREMQRLWRHSVFRVNRPEANGSPRASTGGYGYGLGVSQDCRFDHIVGHGGGLPGFGSYMMWLPEYGVGIFAMTNLTYSGPTPAIREAFEVLAKTGGLQKRELPPSPALLTTQRDLVQLWNQWSDAGLDAIAADNLNLDFPGNVYKTDVKRLKAQYTNCRSDREIVPENWLRGDFRMKCDEGDMQVTFTLAPTKPPKVQMLRFTGIPTLSAGLQYTVAKEAARAPYGNCRIGETLSSDGKDQAEVLLHCDRGSVQLNVRGNEAAFALAPSAACLP